MAIKQLCSHLALSLLLLGGFSACSSEADNPFDSPSTICLYPFGDTTIESDFGIACEKNEDCKHGFCMTPENAGNITNNVFSFCSRGCDCNDVPHSTISGNDTVYDCVYPGGCFVGSSKGAWRHAVLLCNTLEDCTDVDPRYTHCEDTNVLTVVPDKTCGLHKVCQAHK